MEGVNEDFEVPGRTESLFLRNPPPFNVDVSLRVDGIALEQDEEFTLRVEGISALGMEIIAGGTFGMFVSSEIRVVIQDLESKKCF